MYAFWAKSGGIATGVCVGNNIIVGIKFILNLF
jgi:hypothetical protein